MCGIVGYAGARDALPILVDSLKRLEYRGYDSAGVAVLANGGVVIHKDKGYIANLERGLPDADGSVTGIAHTRWATHGKPSQENAHPFLDCSGEIAIAHNGIVENYLELRERLQGEGHKFTSETDTETVAHLVEKYYEGDLKTAVRKALGEVRGAYAFLAVHSREPGKVVAARNESPLVIGLGVDENFVASDIPALLKHTTKVAHVMDGEFVIVTPEGVTIEDSHGEVVTREPERIDWTFEDAEKGGFEHFMLKEIFETPRALHDTLLGREVDAELNSLLHGVTSVKLLAMGTSYHAALAGKWLLENVAHVPATAEMASEYRYSAHPGDKPLVIVITQSGETTDTLGAAREAGRRGCPVVAITNVVGSSITREVDATLFTRAGIEIGVAATKTFVAQLALLYLLAIAVGLRSGALTPAVATRLRESLRTAPRAIQSVLNDAEAVRFVAEKYHEAHSMFVIGRGANFPIAMEGALKVKEISYIHAEAYAAGELKHGPLALLTKDTPVVAVAVRDSVYEKTLSNIGESAARGPPIIAVGTDGDKELLKRVDDVLWVPKVDERIYPLPVTVAFQLFAYHLANLRGCEIDKPRNLAKSVTVE
jgi:glucosamine--fructose-6-phosphate aminotransferase (isomerizing)